MVSAGFDGHCRDAVNEGFGLCTEWDYYWMTRYLMAVANEYCEGRIGNTGREKERENEAYSSVTVIINNLAMKGDAFLIV